MKITINDHKFETSLYDWPEESVVRNVLKEDNEFIITNDNLSDESIKIVIDVVTKNISRDVLNPDSVDWKNYKVMIDCLELPFDFIYPLFLHDREIWFKEFNMKEESLILMDKMVGRIRESNYDVINKGTIRVFEDDYYYTGKHENVADIINKLSHIPNLFIAGGYALAKFSNQTPEIDVGMFIEWNDIDVFAYGPDALKNLLEGVWICLGVSDYKLDTPGKVTLLSQYSYPPIRTRYAISIPINLGRGNPIIIQFILMKFSSPFHILNSFDIDSCCVGFEIKDKNKFYSTPRFIRAYETMSNTIDPTRQSSIYIQRLIKYLSRGFDIAIPGLNMDTVRIKPSILNTMIEDERDKKLNNLQCLKLTGLEGLIVSSVIHSNITCSKPSVGVYDSIHLWDIHTILKKYIESKKDIFTYIVDIPVNEALNIRSIDDVVSEDGKLSFVVGDVLNEGERDFSFRLSKHEEFTFYEPKYPIIELIDDIYREKIAISFYEEYYF
uniref:Ankyrin repeat protein n=1 Tax=Pithovirus LCPAC401 TaxID=2506595 RepID=A0A481Z9L3_9VIRU|nr:MAG: hypothetical protein LCPAC401_02160 [Pithovirus LCPAC401]